MSDAQVERRWEKLPQDKHSDSAMNWAMTHVAELIHQLGLRPPLVIDADTDAGGGPKTFTAHSERLLRRVALHKYAGNTPAAEQAAAHGVQALQTAESDRLAGTLEQARQTVKAHGIHVPISLDGNTPYHQITPVQQLVRRVALHLVDGDTQAAERSLPDAPNAHLVSAAGTVMPARNGSTGRDDAWPRGEHRGIVPSSAGPIGVSPTSRGWWSSAEPGGIPPGHEDQSSSGRPSLPERKTGGGAPAEGAARSASADSREGAPAPDGQALQDLARAQEIARMAGQGQRGEGASFDGAPAEGAARQDQAWRDAVEAESRVTRADLALLRSPSTGVRFPLPGLLGGAPWKPWFQSNPHDELYIGTSTAFASTQAAYNPYLARQENPYHAMERQVFPAARHFRDTDEAMRYGIDHWGQHIRTLNDRSRVALEHYSRSPENWAPTLPYRVSFREIRALNLDRATSPLSSERMTSEIHSIYGHRYRDSNGDYLVELPSGERRWLPEAQFIQMATEETQRDLEAIHSELEAHPVPEALVVSRGVDETFFSAPPEACVGCVFHDASFLSTSLGPPGRDMPVIVHLLVPRGTPALYIASLSRYPHERELLIQRGRDWRVVHVAATYGKVHVFGEILTPAPTPTPRPRHSVWWR
ncbi:ADP-ribosyltransferase [Streptomyces nigra]|uniref:ADP-ribosyltransferase n=1 Tax=Streptomyces nigra TaxID=1827580 RepID=UPI003659AD3F